MPDITDSAVMDRLAALATARFAWKWEETQIANTTWPLAVASDPDGMLIEACERQDAGETGVIDPFWATTWRAAAGLDQYLDRLPLDNVDVLELGCGTGHAGIAAALRGANVVLTDGVEDPLLLVRMSCLPVRDRCRVERLRFGIDQIADQQFPIILGSDVTYLRQLWPELETCWRQHLAADGQVLLSDPFRIISTEFRQWITDRDWDYQEHRIELADDIDHPIRVMQLRLPAS
ncbi:MAG: SAM-dependent methyltransferase [Pirellulaceae bacterium]|nr:SAM-dependent methyltransferase [Pirellulaceae bacterium]